MTARQTLTHITSLIHFKDGRGRARITLLQADSFYPDPGSLTILLSLTALGVSTLTTVFIDTGLKDLGNSFNTFIPHGFG